MEIIEQLHQCLYSPLLEGKALFFSHVSAANRNALQSLTRSSSPGLFTVPVIFLCSLEKHQSCTCCPRAPVGAQLGAHLKYISCMEMCGSERWLKSESPTKTPIFFSLTWVTKLQAQKPFTACPVLGGEGLAASTYVGRKNLITSRDPSPLACPKMIVNFGKIRVQSHRHLL